MSHIIVSGTTAYDNIMITDTDLQKHLVDKEMGKINISYTIKKLYKENGGTGANIAYNLALLDTKTILLSSVGYDYEYSSFFKEKINLSYTYKSEKELTPRSYITLDRGNSQISAFFSGNINHCNSNIDKSLLGKYAIVSPNNIDIMKQHIKIFKDNGMKVFFDPGQQITQMTKGDLEYCFGYSDYIILNEYEYELIKKQAEKTDEDMISGFERMILTYGIRGSKIFDNNYNIIDIEGVENPNYIESTGAGEAYRAGLLKGLNEGYDWFVSARIGAILASLSTGKIGAQQHNVSWEDMKDLYKKTFGDII